MRSVGKLMYIIVNLVKEPAIHLGDDADDKSSDNGSFTYTFQVMEQDR